MIPLLERPHDTEATVQYLLEENALLKEACLMEREEKPIYKDAAIAARIRIRRTLTLIDEMLVCARANNEAHTMQALDTVKSTLTEETKP